MNECSVRDDDRQPPHGPGSRKQNGDHKTIQGLGETFSPFNARRGEYETDPLEVSLKYAAGGMFTCIDAVDGAGSIATTSSTFGKEVSRDALQHSHPISKNNYTEKRREENALCEERWATRKGKKSERYLNTA